MHLATLAGLPSVPHPLFRLTGGALAYVTQHQGQKLALVLGDVSQAADRKKCDGSHEQVAKVTLRYSANLGLDVVNYYELMLSSFLTGNADRHLKNFSLLHTTGLGYGPT
jgi:serine/threonine-protein kinase HipA